MKILALDIAYFMGWIFIDYNISKKTVSIIDSGVVDLKKKKDHKDYWLRIETEKLIQTYSPNLVIYEEQFQNLMFRIEGAVAAAVPPNIDVNKIFSRRARVLIWDNGALSKEEANDKIVEIYPQLKGKIPDILDAAVLFEAWKIALETGQPLKAPKKPKKKKDPNIVKSPKKQKITKSKKETPG